MRVLVVEDEPKMARLLQRGLRESGALVEVAADGPAGLETALFHNFDAIVLDVMLPGLSGFEVCARLRGKAVWTPVLMLTARDAVGDRVTGLDGGADDYLVKPFHFEELQARLRALVRRGPVERPTTVRCGDLELEPASQRVWKAGRELELTVKEFLLVETLLRNREHVLTKDALIEHCWDGDHQVRSNVVEVHIRALRRKFAEADAQVNAPADGESEAGSGQDASRGQRARLDTVRGLGYRLRAVPPSPVVPAGPGR